MRTSDGLGPGLGQAEALHLALADQVADCARDILDRHGRIHAVLVEHVDRIDAEAAKRPFGDAADVLGAAAELARNLLAVLEAPAKLGRDVHLVAVRVESVAGELLVGEGTIDLRGVEQCDAEVDRLVEQRDHGIHLIDVVAEPIKERVAGKASQGISGAQVGEAFVEFAGNVRHVREARPALGDVDGAVLARPVVEVLEEMTMEVAIAIGRGREGQAGAVVPRRSGDGQCRAVRGCAWIDPPCWHEPQGHSASRPCLSGEYGMGRGSENLPLARASRPSVAGTDGPGATLGGLHGQQDCRSGTKGRRPWRSPRAERARRERTRRDLSRGRFANAGQYEGSRAMRRPARKRSIKVLRVTCASWPAKYFKREKPQAWDLLRSGYLFRDSRTNLVKALISFGSRPASAPGARVENPRA